jgi:predicted outer membrane repeat protein
VIDGFTIRNGRAAGGGGAIKSEHNNYTTLSLGNCLFTDNTAATGDGGAVVATGQYTPTYIVNCDFLNNRAPAAAMETDVRGGQGGRGGALFMDLEFGTQSQMTNCTFRGNTCGRFGGALAVDLHNAAAVSLTVERCRFESNTSAGDGGAIYSMDGWGNTLTIRECVFSGNSAVDGAAIGGSEYWQGGYILQNCLIVGNKGTFAVMNDGWRSDGLALDLSHCTIAGNTGGGVYCNPHNFGAGLRIRSTIIANNGATGVNYLRGTCAAADLTSNDVYGQAANYAGDTAAGAGSISQDPLFAAPATGNYHLTPASPCKDASKSIGVSVDLDGTARPQGAGFDMGAYEYVVPPAAK